MTFFIFCGYKKSRMIINNIFSQYYSHRLWFQLLEKPSWRVTLSARTGRTQSCFYTIVWSKVELLQVHSYTLVQHRALLGLPSVHECVGISGCSLYLSTKENIFSGLMDNSKRILKIILNNITVRLHFVEIGKSCVFHSCHLYL